MADTFEEIFKNTSLGGTELDDGEHTLVTTDSATSYVVKDMTVSGTTDLSDTYLELNGFNVGTITENKTGSLIIPPSSTLKIKTSDYPSRFYEKQWLIYPSTNQVMVEHQYFDAKGNSAASAVQGYSGNNASQKDSAVDARIVANASNVNELYYVTSDANSDHRLFKQNALGYNTSGSPSQLFSNSYDARAFVYSETLGWINVRLDGSQDAAYLKYVVLGGSNSEVQPTNLGGNRSNGSYFGTHSSYPAAHGSHGWFWYKPNSNYYDRLYGININNGTEWKFDLNASTWAFVNGYPNFVVAYVPSTDKFRLWHLTSNSTVGYADFPVTKTYMESIDNSSTQNQSFSSSDQASFTLTTTANTTYTSSSINGYDKNGNFVYGTNSSTIRTVDTSNTEVDVVSSPYGPFSNGRSETNDNRAQVFRESLMTTQQATDLSLSSPTFGLMLTGIKSTT